MSNVVQDPQSQATQKLPQQQQQPDPAAATAFQAAAAQLQLQQQLQHQPMYMVSTSGHNLLAHQDSMQSLPGQGVVAPIDTNFAFPQTETPKKFDPATSAESDKARKMEGSWECEKCGNVNYSNRTVCNIRKCQAPKPLTEWVCICGNKNYKNRDRCNMRKCGLPRPADPQAQLALTKLRSSGSLDTVSTPVLFGNPSIGSWVCKNCNNLNYPQRTTCNGHNCGRPRNEVDTALFYQQAGAPQVVGASGMPGQVVSPMSFPMQLVNGASQSIPATAQQFQQMTNQMVAGEAQAPEGSWTCGHCGNLNWPRRTQCNKRGCGQPRPTVLTPEGSTPSLDAMTISSPAPANTPGSINVAAAVAAAGVPQVQTPIQAQMQPMMQFFANANPMSVQ